MGDVLKLYDVFYNLRCKCQKQIVFTPRQFQLERAGFKSTMEKIFKGTGKMWICFLKPGLTITTPIIAVVVAAKTKIHKRVK